MKLSQWLGENQYQCSLSIEAAQVNGFHKYHRQQLTKYPEFRVNDVKINDKFEIRFDFVKKECSVYWNGKFISILHDKLPDKLYPAASCCMPHEFECTKWQLLYKLQ